MAVFVSGGADAMDAFGGGMLDEQTQNWFAQHTEQLRHSISGAAQSFFDRSRQLYQSISDSQAMQMLRNLRAKDTNVWTGNFIEPLKNLEALQTTGPIMQRWIMAEPELRTRYLNQEVEGYADSYVNHGGDAVGSDHYDYRRVTNHMVMFPDDDDADYVVRSYFELMEEGERELTFHEKVDILNTWDMVRHYLEDGGEDPTSPYGNAL